MATSARSGAGSAVASTSDALGPAALLMAAGFLLVTLPVELLTAPDAVRAHTATAQALGGLACAAVGWRARTRRAPRGRERATLLARVAVLTAVVTSTALVTLASYRTPLTIGGFMLILVAVVASVHVRWVAAALCAGVLASWSVVARWRAPELLTTDSASVLALSVVVGTILHVSWRGTVRRLEVARARLAAMALTDELTGIGNRRAFFEHGVPGLGLARAGDREVALLYVDVDGLKAVNDASGHVAGDRLIRSVAEALSGLVRAEDVLARVGGDEFAVLLTDCDEERALDVCHRLTAALAAVGAAASCGVVHAGEGADAHPVGAVVGPDGAREELERLLALADDRMYAQKRRDAPPQRS